MHNLQKANWPSWCKSLKDIDHIKSINKMIHVVFFLKAEEHNEVDNELANRMSLFYANATPMLKTLSDATTKFVSKVGHLIFTQPLVY